MLASAFVTRFAQRLGRKLEPPSTHDVARLKSCPWPGNVRELENVIDRALPEASVATIPKPTATEGDAIRTVAEMEELERNNIVRALEAANWRVAGDNGAAHVLGMKPSTLSSRMKALGIKKP